MKQAYLQHLIPHVERRIERILREQGLTPETPPGDFIIRHKGKKHRYATPARRADGRTVIFYARLHDNEDARNKFLCDIAYLKLLQKNTRTAPYVPTLFAASTRKKQEWFIREHILAEPLGTIYACTRQLTRTHVPLFVDFFLNMRRLPRARGVTLEQRNGDFSVPIAEGNLRRVKSLFSTPERKTIKSFFHSAYQTFNTQSKAVIHGDCHAGNILFNGSQLYLIDWETPHLNLNSMDIAYFYVGLSHLPTFRKQVLAAYEKRTPQKKQFRELFPLAASFYALNILFSLSLSIHDVPKSEQADIRRYCVHIVKKATKGYTTLRRL